MVIRLIAGLVIAAGLVIGNLGVTQVYAQSNQELLQTIQQMRQQIDTQQKQLHRLEQTLEQRVETTVKKAVEMQPPQSLLGMPPMPPAAASPPLGLFLNIEPQWIGFRGVEAEYAANGWDDDDDDPFGPLATVDVDREFAASYTVGFHLPGGNGIISATYLGVDADNSARTTATLTDELAAVLMPTAPSGGDPIIATAKNEVEISQFDIQYQYPIQMTRRLVFTPEVGVRLLKFENQVEASYFEEDSPLDLIGTVVRTSDSEAFGPKVALTTTWGSFNGFSVTAKGGAGWLVGENDAEYLWCRGQNFDFPICGRNFSYEVDKEQSFPFVEGEFRLNYTAGRKTLLKGFSASVGYRLASYFDILTVSKVVSNGRGRTVLQKENVTSDSIFLRLQYLF